MDNRTLESVTHLDEKSPAIIWVGLIIVATSLMFLAIPLDRWIPLRDFFPEDVRMLALYNSIRQRAAHAVWALLTVLTCLVILYGPNSVLGSVPFPRDRWRTVAWLTPTLSAAAIVCSVWSDPTYDKRIVYIGFPFLLIVLLLLPHIGEAMQRLRDRYLWFALAAVLGLFLVPGFFATAAVDTSSLVNGLDYHYSVVLGSVQLLRDPAIDPQLINFNYGLLSAFSAARLGALFHVDSFGGYIRLVQGYQIIFAILLIISAYAFSRGNKYFLLLMPVAAGPWVSTMSPSVMVPNQSGWRMMMFAVLPLMIVAVRSMQASTLRVLLTLAFSSAAVLWNFETGIAVAAAVIATALLCEYRNGRSIVALISIALSAGLGTTLLLSLGYSAMVGGGLFRLPPYVSGIIVGGYSGLKHPNDFFAVGLAALTTIILIQGCVAARNGTLTDAALERSTIGVAIIVWFAYYANRPALQDLWTLFVLGLFMIEPVTRPEFWAMRVRRFPHSVAEPTTLLALMAVIFVPLIALTFNYDYRFMHLGIEANLQGLSVSPETAALEREKAHTLSNSPLRTIYFSAAPSMTGFMTGKHNPSLPFDPFGETWTATRFRELVDRINALKPDRIIIEPPNGPLLRVSEPRQVFFARLRTALASRFESKEEAGGWEIWEPTSAHN